MYIILCLLDVILIDLQNTFITHMNTYTIGEVQIYFILSLIRTVISNKVIYSPEAKFNFEEPLLQP